MAKLDYEWLFFPVELRDAYYPVIANNVRSAQESDGMKRRIPGVKVLVNAETEEAISVVSRSYRVIPHAAAFKAGLACAAGFFGRGGGESLDVFNLIASKNGSFFHLDLRHQEVALRIRKKDDYFPFLRISNSYNRSSALAYDLGFYRVVCENGAIVPSIGFRYRLAHTKRERLELPAILFDAKKEGLSSLKKQFAGWMEMLFKVRVPILSALPLIIRACGYAFDLEAKEEKKREEEVKRLDALGARVGPLVERYFAEHGENAYAVYCALTDYASRPVESARASLMIDGLQRKAGAWALEFSMHAAAEGFSLERYVENQQRWIAA